MHKCFLTVGLVLLLNINNVLLFGDEPRTQLKVALYPYLPDTCSDAFQSFENRIEQEFEALYPEIDLILRPLNAEGSFYNYSYLTSLLDEYDLIETDSVYLDRLINNGLLQPWQESPCKAEAWQPIPRSICEKTTNYSWPHWQCGYFLFGRTNDLKGITSFPAFIESLTTVPPGKIPLAINLSNALGLAEIYMDAWTDQAANATFNQDSYKTYHNQTQSNLSTLADYTCTAQGTIPSLDGTYNTYENLAALLFTKGEAAYYIGYSEDYSLIHANQRYTNDSISAIHAPWGDYHKPTLALDSLVISKQATPEAQEAALLFANYLTAPETYEWMVLGKDCPETPEPRYLLPASVAAFTKSVIGENPMMMNYYRAIKYKADAMPIEYYSEVSRDIGWKLYTDLHNTVTCRGVIP